MRWRWSTRGYVAIGVITVAVVAGFGFRGETFDAQVVRIVDGDTLCVRCQAGDLVLRLWGVDAPERDQVWGMESKVALGRLCIGEKVRVVVVDVDRYKRRVCNVTLPDGRDVGNELVRAGAAWWAADYAPCDLVKRGLQFEAQAGKVGLWFHPPCQAPWRHRQEQ
jgi:endonuclease YncB( thermonuclease family)